MSVGGFWLKYTIFYLSRVNSPIISLFCQKCQKIVSVNRAGGGWLRLSPYWSCRGQIDPVYSDAGRARRTISGWRVDGRKPSVEETSAVRSQEWSSGGSVTSESVTPSCQLSQGRLSCHLSVYKISFTWPYSKLSLNLV